MNEYMFRTERAKLRRSSKCDEALDSNRRIKKVI